MFSNIIRQLTNRSKTAAMFGLDARIALVIFGALSVISGASLYKAIQQARATATLTSMQEIIKAGESYLLDTGTYLKLFDAGNSNILLQDLVVKNSVPGWKGPYISLPSNATTELSYQGFKVYSRLRLGSNWSSTSFAYPDDCIVNSSDCNEWLYLYTTEQSLKPRLRSLFKYLDKTIDDNDGNNAGRIRFRDNLFSTTRVYFKGILRKRTTN